MIFVILLVAIVAAVVWARRPGRSRARYVARSIFASIILAPYLLAAIAGLADIDALDNWVDASEPRPN